MSGYIFVLSNPLYQDFVLVGASVKTPTERAAELYTEGLLYPFKVEKAKQVATLEGKLVVLHKLIGKMGERPNPDRDFFKVSTDVVEHLFDLIDGTAWTPAGELTQEQIWNNLQEKVGMIMKNEMPKANEFQLSKLKMRVSTILKQQSISEPTLENVRAAMEQAKKEINIQPNAVPTPVSTVPI
jgi:hypothetical protein